MWGSETIQRLTPRSQGCQLRSQIVHRKRYFNQHHIALKNPPPSHPPWDPHSQSRKAVGIRGSFGEGCLLSRIYCCHLQGVQAGCLAQLAQAGCLKSGSGVYGIYCNVLYIKISHRSVIIYYITYDQTCIYLYKFYTYIYICVCMCVCMCIKVCKMVQCNEMQCNAMYCCSLLWI